MTTPLTDHLSVVASTLDGIQRLRELILQLAVMGKLVPQDPGDEPAKLLLERASRKIVEKSANRRIEKDGAIDVGINDKTFVLPVGWEWTRLRQFALVQGGKRLPAGATFSPEPTPFVYIQVTNMKRGSITSENLKFISAEVKEKIKKYTISHKDLYITIAGTIGEIGSVPVEFDGMNLTENAAKIVFEEVHQDWLRICLSSNSLRRQFVEKTNQMAQPKLALHRVADSVLAVPPQPEQQRIASKVDELMMLCDRLETQQTDAELAHTQLVKALLDALTQSQDPPDFASRWERIKQNFDLLFTTEASVDALKRTLLQLAVMGKLIPQLSNDCQTSRGVKKPRNNEKRVESTPQSSPENQQCPRSLPSGWELAQVKDLTEILNGYAFKSEWFSERGIRLVRNINMAHGNIDWTDCARLPQEMVREFSRFELSVGDILLSLDRPIISTGLKYAVVSADDLPCLLLQRVARIALRKDVVDAQFFVLWLNSPFFVGVIDPGRSNGIPHISTKQVEELPFWLPPLAEQGLIVSKVDELMTVCDHLKAQLRDARALQEIITTTVMSQAVSENGSHLSIENPEKLLVPT